MFAKNIPFFPDSFSFFLSLTGTFFVGTMLEVKVVTEAPLYYSGGDVLEKFWVYTLDFLCRYSWFFVHLTSLVLLKQIHGLPYLFMWNGGPSLPPSLFFLC